MSQNSTQPPLTDYLHSLFATARRRPGLWIAPLIGAVVLGLVAVFVLPKTWDATQSIVVREELIGRVVGPGRFESLDTMKTAQEVIQEIARRPVVLKRVLNQVGEDSTPEDVESLQEAVTFRAPGGAELGNTEILIMRVKAETAQKAKKLVEALFDETRQEIRTVRSTKAASMVKEVGGSVKLAEQRMRDTTDRMRDIEVQVGGDLSELRSLVDPSSSGSELRRMISTIQQELRQATNDEQNAAQLIQYLENLEAEQLIATPRELLDSQPALLELKRRLIAAQAERSTAGGIYSRKHPRYIASNSSVNDLMKQMTQEIDATLVGLRAQKKLAATKTASLKKQIGELEDRVVKLATLRVDYGQLEKELQLRNEELSVANREYSQIQSILYAAKNVDFIIPLDEAQAGVRPLGLSKKVLMLGSVFVGLLIGVGLVMLVTPAPVLQSRAEVPSFEGGAQAEILPHEAPVAPATTSAVATFTESPAPQELPEIVLESPGDVNTVGGNSPATGVEQTSPDAPVSCSVVLQHLDDPRFDDTNSIGNRPVG